MNLSTILFVLIIKPRGKLRYHLRKTWWIPATLNDIDFSIRNNAILQYCSGLSLLLSSLMIQFSRQRFSFLFLYCVILIFGFSLFSISKSLNKGSHGWMVILNLRTLGNFFQGESKILPEALVRNVDISISSIARVLRVDMVCYGSFGSSSSELSS